MQHLHCKKYIIGLFGLMLIGASPAASQLTNTSAGAFLRYGAGTAALSVGQAFTAAAHDPSAVYWNPAGLVQVRDYQWLFSSSQLPFERTFRFAAFNLPLTGYQNLGFGWLGLTISGLEARRNNTPEPDYLFSDSENAFFFSYSRRLRSDLLLGGSVKLLYMKLASKQGMGASVDAGLLYKPFDTLRLGLSLQNIGSAINWSGGYREFIPLQLRLGLVYRLMPNLLLLTDLASGLDSGFKLFMGAQLKVLPNLPLRLGFGPQGPAAGVAIHFLYNRTQWALDYGIHQDAISGNLVHQFSLKFTLKKKAPNMPLAQKPRPSRKRGIPFFETIEVDTELLNVRSGPGIQYKVIDQVRQGERYKKMEQIGLWVKIRTRSGKIGWVHSSYVVLVTAAN